MFYGAVIVARVFVWLDIARLIGRWDCKVFILNFNIMSAFAVKNLGVGLISTRIFKVCNRLIY
jgi:hypothetical protein